MSSGLLYLAQKVQCHCTQKNMKNYFMHTKYTFTHTLTTFKLHTEEQDK